MFWTVLTAVCLYGMTKMPVDFSTRFFIDESKYIYAYYEFQDKYLSSGFTLTTYVDSPLLDYSSKET